MSTDTYFDYSPIYALASAYGKSAIAVFRTSGEGTFALFQKIFSKKIDFDSITKPTIKYGYIIEPKTSKKVDEVVISIYPKGSGYTKEEAIEISTHGSIAVINKMNKVLEDAGFRGAKGGEFSYRAFKNGALTLTEAEAVKDIIESESDKTLSAALKSREGFLDKRINDVYDKLISLSSLLELQLDYSEDEYDEDVSYPKEKMEEIKKILLELLQNYSVSTHLKNGINVVLAGETNVGKSTLFNTLLKQNRSIVSNQKGTTRDFIKESIELDGTLINLYDTAGLNKSANGIERIGIKRTNDLLKNADVIINMKAYNDKKTTFVSLKNKPIIKVLSKVDLCKDKKNINVDADVTMYSNKTKQGISEIIKRLTDIVNREFVKSSDNFTLISQTTKNAIQKAYDNIVFLKKDTPIEASTEAVKEAIFSLSELLGKENPTDEVLSSLFSTFCVGK